MNYILDDLGYLEEISFGGKIVCSNKSCTEYNGNIPSGYETLLEWSINANIRAYKIIDGDLVYDENRDNELKRQFEIETEENKNATQKWVRDKFWKTNSVYDDELSINIDGSSLFTLDNAKESEFVSLKLTPNKHITGDLKINISNENMLENKASTQTIGGVKFTANNDGTITLNGTSTETIELVLNGTLTSEDILFFLKNNINYMKGGLPSNVGMNLYCYNGTDRELASSGGNGTLNFTDTKYITCVSLTIASGQTFKDIKVSPMITIGKYEEKPYVEHKGNELLTFDLGSYIFRDRDYILIERERLYFYTNVGLYPNVNLKAGKNVFPIKEKLEIINTIIDSLTSYEGITIIQCDKDINFNIKYFTKDYLNERFANIQVEQDKITLEVSKKANTTDLDNAVAELSSTITSTAETINLEVSKKVGDNEIISKINQSAEQITINANKLNLNGYLTISNANNTYATQPNLQATNDSLQATNNNLANNYSSNEDLKTSGKTIISGGNIKGDAIQSNNYVSGTSGTKINLVDGTIDTTNFKVSSTGSITATSGKVATWNIGTSGLISDSESSYLFSDGRMSLRKKGWFNAGDVGYFLLGKGTESRCLIGDSYEMGSSASSIANNLTVQVIPSYGYDLHTEITGTVGIASNAGNITIKSGGSLGVRSTNINITASSSMVLGSLYDVYIRTIEGNFYINGQIYSGSSSRNMKTNIVEFTNKDENKLYNAYKNMKIYNYDYLEKYGNEKNQIGFMLEEIDSDLYKLIDGQQDERDENIKRYNPTKLIKTNTALISILIKKIESLEEKLNVN